VKTRTGNDNALLHEKLTVQVENSSQRAGIGPRAALCPPLPLQDVQAFARSLNLNLFLVYQSKMHRPAF